MNEVARAGEHTNERTYVRTYVLTYIRTGQILYPLHNFVVRGDNKSMWPDWVPNPGPLAFESDALPTAQRDPASLGTLF